MWRRTRRRRAIHPRFDWQVFAFTAFVSLTTGVLFGLAPAVAAMRTVIADASRRRALVGKPVVGFQIALATLLLIGAGLFIRSLEGLTAVNPGFRTERLLLAQIVLPQNRYPARCKRRVPSADGAGDR